MVACLLANKCKKQIVRKVGELLGIGILLKTFIDMFNNKPINVFGTIIP